MTEQPDDQCLVQACRGGDAEAFGVLVRRHQDRLYPMVLRLMGSEEDARDVLQDAFVRAYMKLDQFQGSSSFYTWIYRIAVNLAVSRHRRRSPRPIEIRDRRGLAIAGADPVDLRRDSNPGAALDRVERDLQIQQALDALSPEHRAVVVLKDLEDHRYEEIAAILSVPIGTVRSRLHRARCELKELLSDLVDEDISVHHTQVMR